jgi:hypothetical protein
MAVVAWLDGGGCILCVVYVVSLPISVGPEQFFDEGCRYQCMTIPVGLATVLFYPDIPHNTRVWYLDDEEVRLALARVESAGRAAPAKITLSTFLGVLKRWSIPAPPCRYP